MREEIRAVAHAGSIYVTPHPGARVIEVVLDTAVVSIERLRLRNEVPSHVPRQNEWACVGELAHPQPGPVCSILEEASEMVNGPRAADYGDARVNLTRWRDMVRAAGMDLTAEQLVRVMLLLKISRDVHKGKRDNAVDIAGYAELLELARGL